MDEGINAFVGLDTCGPPILSLANIVRGVLLRDAPLYAPTSLIARIEREHPD